MASDNTRAGYLVKPTSSYHILKIQEKNPPTGGFFGEFILEYMTTSTRIIKSSFRKETGGDAETELPDEIISQDGQRRFNIYHPGNRIDQPVPARGISYDVRVEDGSWVKSVRVQEDLSDDHPQQMVFVYPSYLDSTSVRGGHICAYSAGYKGGGKFLFENWSLRSKADPEAFYREEKLPEWLDLRKTLSDFFDQVGRRDFSRPTLIDVEQHPKLARNDTLFLADKTK